MTHYFVKITVPNCSQIFRQHCFDPLLSKLTRFEIVVLVINRTFGSITNEAPFTLAAICKPISLLKIFRPFSSLATFLELHCGVNLFTKPSMIALSTYVLSCQRFLWVDPAVELLLSSVAVLVLSYFKICKSRLFEEASVYF